MSVLASSFNSFTSSIKILSPYERGNPLKSLRENLPANDLLFGIYILLKDEVLKWRQNYKDVYKQLEDSEERLEISRTQVANKSEADSEIESKIKENNKILGLTEVKGSGIIIRLDDNREVEADEVLDVSLFLVHDMDLIHIVNELYNAGADAISINGKRIVSTTSILCDGNIIRVNGEIVGVPIEIKAIGHPEALYYNVALRTGGYVRLMANDGVVVEIEKSDNITIPKYEGIYKSEYISEE